MILASIGTFCKAAAGGGAGYTPLVITQSSGLSLSGGDTIITDTTGDARFASTNAVTSSGAGYEEVYITHTGGGVVIGLNSDVFYGGLPPYNNFSSGISLYFLGTTLYNQGANSGFTLTSGKRLGFKRDKTTGDVTAHEVTVTGGDFANATFGTAIYTVGTVTDAGLRVTGYGANGDNSTITVYVKGF